MKSNMKFCLAILSIIMMIQVSMAGPLTRSKRDNVVDFGDSVINFFSKAVLASIVASEHALEKMPKSDAYAPYRKELEDYLVLATDSKGKEGNCFRKILEAANKFEMLTDRYGQHDAAAEAKEVIKWLHEAADDTEADLLKSLFMSILRLAIPNDNDAVNEAEREKLIERLTTAC